MSEGGIRRLRDGRTVAVHRNGGLRKVCGCTRRVWAKCPHPWHLNVRWKGQDFRLSLNRYAGKPITDKTAAEELAAEIKRMIRAGTFNPQPAPSPQPVDDERRGQSFDTVADAFVKQFSQARGKVSWSDDQSMLRQVAAFTPPEAGAQRLGAKPIEALTEEDLEAFLRHLAALGRTVATRNHYVTLFRTVDRWLVRKGYRAKALLSGESAVIRKCKANKRHRRLEPKEEARLLAPAGPHLESVVICALETGFREGEILGLQWTDVSLGGVRK